MLNEASPIIDYYPPDFECDLNGKQQEWEVRQQIEIQSFKGFFKVSSFLSNRLLC